MRRLGMVGLLLVVVSELGCQSDQNGQNGTHTAVVFDQLAGREIAYHTAVSRLPNAAAVQTETSSYTTDMHELIDDMRQACEDMMHGGSMMGGHDLNDVYGVMDQMRGCIDDYYANIRGMSSLDSMRVACNDHHQRMETMFQQMEPMTGSTRGCCSGW